MRLSIKGFISLFLLYLFIYLITLPSPSFALGNVTACGDTITQAETVGSNGTYWQLNGTSYTFESGRCITIAANDIVLNLNGKTIVATGVAVDAAGILVITNNTQVHNGTMNISISTCCVDSDEVIFGIWVEDATNVTIQNFTFANVSAIGAGQTVAINISNPSERNTTHGYFIRNVNISNVTNVGINIENASNVRINDSWFGAAPLAWQTNAAAIRAAMQSSSFNVSVETTMFNATTNVSLFFWGNLSVYLQPNRPSAAPSGTGSAGGSKISIDKMINLTGASSSTRANLTFWFNSSDIAAASDGNRLTIHRTSDSISWSDALSTSLNLIGTNSLTATNIASFSAFALFGDATSNKQSDSTSPKPLVIDFSSSVKLSCPDNKLEISATTKGESVSDVLVRLILYEPYEGFKQDKLTDAEGKAVFDLTNERDGRYQLDSSKSGYQKPEDVFFDFVHCVVVLQPTEEVEEPTVEPTPTPPIVEPPPEPEPEPMPSMQDATNAISDAETAISNAEKENKDVSVALARLEEAKRAMDNNDYQKAISFAAEAVNLANNAKPKEIKPAPLPQPKPEQPKEDKPVEEQKQGGLDMGQIVLGLAAVGVVGFAVYKLAFRKEGYKFRK